jgi:hypothetical protein
LKWKKKLKRLMMSIKNNNSKEITPNKKLSSNNMFLTKQNSHKENSLNHLYNINRRKTGNETNYPPERLMKHSGKSLSYQIKM